MADAEDLKSFGRNTVWVQLPYPALIYWRINMPFTDKCDKCDKCDNIMEFKVMMENDENPMKHHLENLCGECLHKLSAGVIETWTFSEWDN